MTCSRQLLYILVFYLQTRGAYQYCPNPYTAAGRYCYVVTDGTYSWYDAQNLCMGLAAGALATIRSAAESTAIETFLNNNGITVDVWIGLRDSGTGTDFKWIWNESTATYVNWDTATAQPNRAQVEIGPTDSACTHLRFEYAFRWNDFSCAAESRALCMRPLFEIEIKNDPHGKILVPELQDDRDSTCLTLKHPPVVMKIDKPVWSEDGTNTFYIKIHHGDVPINDKDWLAVYVTIAGLMRKYTEPPMVGTTLMKECVYDAAHSDAVTTTVFQCVCLQECSVTFRLKLDVVNPITVCEIEVLKVL